MGVGLEITPNAMDLITEKGYDDNYGARPLKRVIQRYIEDKLSESITNNRCKNTLIRCKSPLLFRLPSVVCSQGIAVRNLLTDKILCCFKQTGLVHQQVR